MRRGYLSYTILKVQRNEYITLMLIYVSVALNLYLGLLHHMYTKRGKYYKDVTAVAAEKAVEKDVASPTTTSGIRYDVK